ncbi:MAG: hypothetical protein QNL91_08420 [Candidatus Krumholzibacteria bacterium]|nr:hypothetical protein [Candidatus Krumholzibacteria bacterium]
MNSSRFVALILLLPLIAICGCEGDAGPAGPAGATGATGDDGANGSTSCLECHNTDIQTAISLQYIRSQHAYGEYVEYTGGENRASCARCHNGAGFAEFIETGGTDGAILSPVPIACNHCHTVHTTFEGTDYALRGTAAVPWIGDAGHGDTVGDFGDNSNVCANCHQSRRAEPNIAAPGATFEITSTHYGPHHGAMANVLNGSLFAEIPGSTVYPTTSLHVTAGATCVTCHMGEYADGTGGHTWWPSLSSCTACHATTSFDYGGVQTEVAGLLDDLQTLLLAAGVIEFVVEDDAYEPIVGTYPMVQVQAYFNWIGLSEDRSLGVHNPRYVVALLENSIEAMPPVPVQ